MTVWLSRQCADTAPLRCLAPDRAASDRQALPRPQPMRAVRDQADRLLRPHLRRASAALHQDGQHCHVDVPRRGMPCPLLLLLAVPHLLIHTRPGLSVRSRASCYGTWRLRMHRHAGHDRLAAQLQSIVSIA